MKKRTIILGHRGYNAKFPENTVYGAQKAMHFGADGVEFDVQKTPAGFIVFHDTNAFRMTGVDHDIRTFSADSLRRLRVCEREKIPYLHEYLSCLPQGCFVNLELKMETVTPEDFGGIDEILRPHRADFDFLVSSFRHDLLYDYRRAGYRVGMLFGRETFRTGLLRAVVDAFKLRPDYLNVPVRIFSRCGFLKKVLIRFAASIIKARIALWTVNTADQFDIAFSMGDIIITDYVEYAVELRWERERKILQKVGI